ncbi:MAG: lipid IV(A) palmitoyltransferase PagP [Legionella sp.]|nr:MAG: lipid IV(A) palmitoyltransferase PagP [Legionella sp.]
MLSLVFFLPTRAFADQDPQACSKWVAFLKPACQHLHRIWTEGKNELYLSGYAWHNRYTYTPERIKTYNELAWGGGFGKGYLDEHGNFHAIAAFAFLDSHKNIEPVVNYSYFITAHFPHDFSIGLGGTVLITSRPDILNGIPFIGALPAALITFKKTTIGLTYIPGAVGAGNVLYIVGKYTF